jgi:YHS domain-containing protein
MKHLKQTVLALGLAAVTPWFLAGCKESSQASHDGHDHSHDGSDHGTEVAQAAEAVKDAATAALIEKPTAEQIAAAKAYPLDTCIASGEKLDSMGEPVTTVYNGQQVKFCCESCIDDFKKEPAKFVAKLTAK